MVFTDGESGRATFFYDSPVITREIVSRTHLAWVSGQTIGSEAVAIGHIGLTETEARLFGSAAMLDATFTNLTDGPLFEATRELRDGFTSLVLMDLRREGCDIGEDIEVRASGGYFGVWEVPWASEDSKYLVQYRMLHGAGHLLSAAGETSRSDIIQSGEYQRCLMPGIEIGGESRLQPVEHPAGAIVRNMLDLQTLRSTGGGLLQHLAVVHSVLY